MIFRCARPAMATLFEVFLIGSDEEHLMAVGESALDEVARVDRLLSRHDPASETSRINREAGSRPVRVDREMFALLERCRAWSLRTRGYFDICAYDGYHGRYFDEYFELDEPSGTVRLLGQGTRLDFGGIGKGYALDSASRILHGFGVRSALLQGGTSSVLALGGPGSAWRVGLRDPFGPGDRAAIAHVPLEHRGLSSSAVFGPGSGISDVFDPITSRYLDRQAACSVVAATATEAEVLSTALLAMGKDRARELLEHETFPDCRVAWIDRAGDETEVEWLIGGEAT